MPIANRLHKVLAGKYLVEAFIGAGGMGLVYAATHRMTQERVAVKFLRKELLEDAESTRRFIQEARAVARLRHPNIVRLMDLDVDPEYGLYMVLELLHGESLEERLQREHTLTVAEAHALLRPIMEALGHAHSQQLIHRDVKPANIFLHREADGRITPKLLDFGLVRSLATQGGLHTVSGQVVGTPPHMSPEQARGEKGLQPATDVWSMAVTLYRCLSGVGPFERSSQDGTVLAVMRAQYRPLDERCPQLKGAKALQRVLQSAFTLDPKRRTPNMASLIEQLDASVVQRQRLSRLAPAKWSPLTRLSVVALTAVVLGAAGSFLWQRSHQRQAMQPTQPITRALPPAFTPTRQTNR
jgi:serine/threonine-protein kinase